MPDSPISATPYEILGAAPTATADELRLAHRRALRETHPDTGGSAKRFHAVQHAWDLIGTPAARAIYDRGTTRVGEPASYAARPATAPRESRPQARAYGHPGGWHREQYLRLMREWVGRGTTLDNPYDPALVRSAPREIRHLLAAAIAEEDGARALADLGIAYTVWHDVATDAATGIDAGKLDHIVLGPTGLFSILSEDWGGPVRVKRGELIGETVPAGDRPVNTLSLRTRSIARATRVRFTAIVIVVPDDATTVGITEVGRIRGLPSLLVQRSRLPSVLKDGIDNDDPVGGNELFDARTRLQSTLGFV
jgi:curved DNA-binding protein CbpA